MDTNEFDYYIIGMSGIANAPLLIEDEDCPYYITNEQYVENPERMFFCLGAPIPRNPLMVDYHPVPYTVVSKKICDILQPLSIKGIQLIPATITGKNNELYEDYFYLHIYNIYPLLDKGLSNFSKWNETLDEAIGLSKIVLVKEKLDEISLENRLILKLREKDTFELYHKSVVDAIMATNPEGIVFTSLADWNTGKAFD